MCTAFLMVFPSFACVEYRLYWAAACERSDGEGQFHDGGARDVARWRSYLCSIASCLLT